MIKVCHIVNIITGKADGVFTYLKTIFSNNDNSKYQRIIIFHGNTLIEKEFYKLGVKVYTEPLLNKKFSLELFVNLYRIIKENNIDILHAHFIKPYIISGLLNIFLRKKLIFNYHGIFIDRNPYYGKVEKYLLRLAHRTICAFKAVNMAIVPSEYNRKLLISESKHFPKIKSYYTGYDLKRNSNSSSEIFTEYLTQLKSNFQLVAIIGRLEAEKRIDKALTISKLLLSSNKEVKFVIIGDGSLEENLKQLAKEMGLLNQVHFIEFIPDLISYFGYFDALLLTSDREGFPNVIWEAMAKGVPVVASDVGGIGEIFNKHKSGLLYQKDDIGDAASKLNLILTDDNLRSTIITNGKSAIENYYNADNFMKRLDEIYHSLYDEGNE